jgi:hypothetical protein
MATIPLHKNYSLAEISDTLRETNWDDTDLLEYLFASRNIPDDILYELQERASEFSNQVHYALAPWDFAFPPTKRRLVEMTDDDMKKYRKNEDKEFEKTIEDAWRDYQIPDRPENEVDYACDEAWEVLAEKKRELDAYLKGSKRIGSYVPPSMRKDDEKAIKLREEIKKLENEFDKCKQRVIEEDEDWRKQVKYDFRINFLLGKEV